MQTSDTSAHLHLRFHPWRGIQGRALGLDLSPSGLLPFLRIGHGVLWALIPQLAKHAALAPDDNCLRQLIVVVSPYSYVPESNWPYLVRPNCLDEPLGDRLLLHIATGGRVSGELLSVSLLLGNVGHGYDLKMFEGYDGEASSELELEQKGNSGR